MQLSHKSPNRELIKYYLRLRAGEDRLAKKKKDIHTILLARLKKGRGRLISASGTALLRNITRRRYDTDVINRLVLEGLLPGDQVGKAYKETHTERVEVNGIPE